jgi:hypothetical protein
MEQFVVVSFVVVAAIFFGLSIARQAGFGRKGDCGCGKCAQKAKNRIKR